MILTFAKCFEKKGIFSLFNEIDSVFISEILPDEDLTIFDDYSVFSIGNYPIFNSSFTPEKLARFCLIKNKTAWKKFNDSLIAEFNLSGKTTTENNTTNVDSDRINNLKVNGYDDSQLVTDTETTDNSDIKQIETKTRTETRENPIEVIDRNIITQKNNKLVDMIVSDIKNTICLDSLDSCIINDEHSCSESVSVDDTLSTTSQNPVQNKVITEKINQVENSIPDVSGLVTKSELQAVENSIPDVSGLATQSSVNAISELIPQNASTSNKLATMADISGGGSVSVDDTLSTTSQNPVQNKVITEKINQVENSIPDVSGLATQSSVNAISELIPQNASTSNKLATMADISGGGSVSVDDTLSTTSQNPVQNKVITEKINQVENSIPDVSGLATQSSVNAISELIPQNASTSNKLATMADISGGGSSEITISETPEYLNEKVIIADITYKKYKVLLNLGANREIIRNGAYDWSGWVSSLSPSDTSFFIGKMKEFLTVNSPYAVLNIRLYSINFTHYFDIQYVRIDKTKKEIKYMILPKIDFETKPTNIYPSGTTASDFGIQTMRYIEVTYLVNMQ